MRVYCSLTNRFVVWSECANDLHVSIVELNVLSNARWCWSQLMWLLNLLASVDMEKSSAGGHLCQINSSEMKRSWFQCCTVAFQFFVQLVKLKILILYHLSPYLCWASKFEASAEKYAYCCSSNKYLPPSSKTAMHSSIRLNCAKLLITAVTLRRKSITYIYAERSRQQAFICFICLSSCL